MKLLLVFSALFLVACGSAEPKSNWPGDKGCFVAYGLVESQPTQADLDYYSKSAECGATKSEAVQAIESPELWQPAFH